MRRRILRITRSFPSGTRFAPRTRFTRLSTSGARRILSTLFCVNTNRAERLPVWELAANETDTMIGYHAVSVIADAMAKGIKGFDYEKAFEAAKHSAELNHFGLEAYKRRGYISMEDEQESVSKTLEYAYDDFCIAQMATILARKKFEEEKARRVRKTDYVKVKMKRLRKIPAPRAFFRKSFRHANRIYAPETKRRIGHAVCAERSDVSFYRRQRGNIRFSCRTTFRGLIELHGGKANFAKKLDELFTTEAKLAGREQPDITGLIGQYAHGNEPSHHIAYLYNYAGEPWKTQRYVRRIMDEFYKPTPDGLIGNEDCGQMSAWYVLSALGFYQVNPSQPVYDFRHTAF